MAQNISSHTVTKSFVGPLGGWVHTLAHKVLKMKYLRMVLNCITNVSVLNLQ